jgi:hypothetical protein
MSDKKISELSAATSINPSDVSVLVSGGVDYKFAFSTLLQFLGTNLTLGANITFGTILLQNTAGKNGDVFINTTTGSFAQKISGTWNIVYTLPSVNSLTDGTVLYGLGAPGTSIGNNNDTYIDTGTGIFYKKATGSWSQVFSMQTGPQGPQGTAGINGTNGTNGFAILNGGTNPSNLSTGVNGDFYINTSNYTFFGPKTAGAWPEGVSLVPPGVIAGGSAGQALTKASDDDYDTEWVRFDDFYVRLDGSYSNPAFINSISWSKISSKPTTIAGYGITDFNTLGDTRWLLLSGGTLTGDVQQPVSPVNANSLITKNYVDNLVTGLTWKKEVKAGTVSNITLSDIQTIDGIALVAGDRVLVKNQTTQSQNGVYIVASGSWTRATDADTTDEIEGATVMVRLGTVNNNTQWTNTNSNEPVIDTDTITFGQIAGAGTYTNGTGINLTANVFSVNKTYTDSLYVPYTGAIANIDLGVNHTLSGGALNSTGGDGSIGQLLGSQLKLSSNILRDIGVNTGFLMQTSAGSQYLYFRADGSIERVSDNKLALFQGDAVPYTGATSAVNLGSQNFTANGTVQLGSATAGNTKDVSVLYNLTVGGNLTASGGTTTISSVAVNLGSIVSGKYGLEINASGKFIVEGYSDPSSTPNYIYGAVTATGGYRIARVSATDLKTFLGLSTGYVPYTGATGNVSLGANSLSVNFDNNTVLASIPNGIQLVNNTLAISGAQIQYSPALYFASSSYQGAGPTRKVEIRQYSTYGNGNQFFNIDYNLGSAGWINMFALGSSGVSTGPLSTSSISVSSSAIISNNLTAAQIFGGIYRPSNSAGAVMTFGNSGTLAAAGNLFTFDAGTQTNSSGLLNVIRVLPTYNQTGTASSTDFLINRTETALGIGPHLFADFQIGGASRFKVDRTGAITSTNNGIGTTPTDGLILSNTTASTTPNNHQFSPALHFIGSRWNGAVSQQVETRMYGFTDTSNSQIFKIDWRLGGTGSYSDVLYITPSGGLQIPGTTTVTGLLTGSVIVANQYLQSQQLVPFAGTTLDVRGESVAGSTTYTATRLYNFTPHINSSGVMTQVSINPTYNQTGTAGTTDLAINRTETALGTGEHLFINFKVGGVSKLKIDRTGNIYGAADYSANYTANSFIQKVYADATFVHATGIETIGGAKTFSATLTLDGLYVSTFNAGGFDFSSYAESNASGKTIVANNQSASLSETNIINVQGSNLPLAVGGIKLQMLTIDNDMIDLMSIQGDTLDAVFAKSIIVKSTDGSTTWRLNVSNSGAITASAV